MKGNEQPENKALLWLIGMGFFMETLDSTIINTSLPTMARDLNTSPLYMQSVIIAYSLTLAVCIPASGWLCDRFGIKKIFLLAISLFSLGSLFCSLSPTLNWLVISRVIQGMGGSMLMPVGRLALLRSYPGDKYLPALSFVAVPALIGPLVGPSLGGWISQTFSWHWIFLVNIPIGILGIIATQKIMNVPEVSTQRKFDFVGFLQMTIFMVCVSLALDGLGEFNFSQGLIMLLFVTGFAALIAYFFHAPKLKQPLISLRLFKKRNFSIGILGNIFARMGSTSMPFLIPMFLQLCLSYSPLDAGLAMLPVSIAAILAKRFISPIITFVGYRRFLLWNTVVVGLSISTFALVTSSELTTLRYILYFIFGFVNSAQFTAMNTFTMKDLSKDDSADGNSVFSMVQMLAMSFSVAAAASLLSGFMKNVDKLMAFQITFLSMGMLTIISMVIFWQIDRRPQE